MPCYQPSNSPPGFTTTGRTSYATEAECNQACKEGACCEGTTCTVKPQCQCQGTGKTFKGVGTVCSPNPCCGCDFNIPFSLSIAFEKLLLQNAGRRKVCDIAWAVTASGVISPIPVFGNAGIDFEKTCNWSGSVSATTQTPAPANSLGGPVFQPTVSVELGLAVQGNSITMAVQISVLENSLMPLDLCPNYESGFRGISSWNKTVISKTYSSAAPYPRTQCLDGSFFPSISDTLNSVPYVTDSVGNVNVPLSLSSQIGTTTSISFFNPPP